MTIRVPDASRLGDGPRVALTVAPMWLHSMCHTSGLGLPDRCAGAMMLGKIMSNI